MNKSQVATYDRDCSLTNKIHKLPKTARGCYNLAKNIIMGNPKAAQNNILQTKLAYGRYYEPIAREKYSNYLKIISREVTIETVV